LGVRKKLSGLVAESRKSGKDPIDSFVYWPTEFAIELLSCQLRKLASKGFNNQPQFVSTTSRLWTVVGFPKLPKSRSFDGIPVDTHLKGELHVKGIIQVRWG
jgi:hypothetical protein